MQIVIPMSGIGRRFLDAGYLEPKPLLKVDGKAVIEHVIGLFPGEHNFLFICNNDHLRDTDMRNILKRAAPSGKIRAIPTHKKGPAYAVSLVFDEISDDEEVIVNYCDFSKYWDYAEFLRCARSYNADGAISAYRGFHPHMLGATNYAFLRNDKEWMLEIREKKPFTRNRMREYASDGTYYFRKGRYVKKYFSRLMKEDINTNGEYYVSMVYNLMKADGLKIFIYEIEHMLQWGAPRDLQEYVRWSDYFRRLIKPHKNIVPQKGSINLIPLAGRGQRFVQEGFKEPKPLILVNGKPMIVQSAACLPEAKKYIFVCLGEHLDNFALEQEVKKAYPHAAIIRIDRVTEGQACTCEMGLRGEDADTPLLIAACDNGMMWDEEKYQHLLDDLRVDAIVWSFRHHASSERNPRMYGWIKVENGGCVSGVSVKKPISENPYEDHAIVGTFYFRKKRYFSDALARLYKKDARVNGEFYVDSCVHELIEMGLCVKVFELDHYVCWGTPDDLRIFTYWQSFFHKCAWHPYRIRENFLCQKALV